MFNIQTVGVGISLWCCSSCKPRAIVFVCSIGAIFDLGCVWFCLKALFELNSALGLTQSQSNRLPYDEFVQGASTGILNADPLTSIDKPSCVPVTFSSELVDVVFKLIDGNSENITKKSINLAAKMKSTASMTQVVLQDASPLQGAIGNISIDESMQSVFEGPFVIASQNWSHSWDPNAFPFPGVPCVVRPLEGRFLVRLVSVSALRKAGMTTLTSLDLFLGQMHDFKKFLQSAGDVRTVVDEGELLYIPNGCIPLLTAVPKDLSLEDHAKFKATALVLPMFMTGSMKAVEPKDVQLVTSNISNGVNLHKASSTIWRSIGDGTSKRFAKLV